MEPLVVIAILWLLGRGGKPKPPAAKAPQRAISPSVTPQMPSEVPTTPPNTSSTTTPTIVDDGGNTGSTPGNFGRRYEGPQVTRPPGRSGPVNKGPSTRPPSAPVTPVYRNPNPTPPPAQVPPANAGDTGTPPPQDPAKVTPIDRGAIQNGGIPDFCAKEYRPFLLSPCAEGTYEPALRPGPPPEGTLVVTGTLPGAQRSNANPSCPNALGQGGVWYMTAGSPEWNAICPPATTAPDA